MKNKRIRKAMTDAGIASQIELCEILGVSQAEISIMLKYELSVHEQNEIVAKIREHVALRKESA